MSQALRHCWMICWHGTSSQSFIKQRWKMSPVSMQRAWWRWRVHPTMPIISLMICGWCTTKRVKQPLRKKFRKLSVVHRRF